MYLIIKIEFALTLSDACLIELFGVQGQLKAVQIRKYLKYKMDSGYDIIDLSDGGIEEIKNKE